MEKFKRFYYEFKDTEGDVFMLQLAYSGKNHQMTEI